MFVILVPYKKLLETVDQHLADHTIFFDKGIELTPRRYHANFSGFMVN